MKKILRVAAILMAFALALGLSACGGSDSSGSTSTSTAAAKTVTTNLAVSSGNQQVTLSWTDSSITNKSSTTSTNTYNVYCATSPGVTTKSTRIAQNLDSTTYIHSGLNNGTTYYYIITAVSPSGVEGAPSREVSATPQAANPAPPTDLKVQAGDGQVTLILAKASSASTGTTYNIYWDTGTVTKDNSHKISNYNFISPFIHSGLTNGQTYRYAVSAQDSAGDESGLSNEVSVTPQSALRLAAVQAVFANASTAQSTGQPSVPPSLAAYADNEQATISWSPAVAPTAPSISLDGKQSSLPNYDAIRVSDGITPYIHVNSANAPITFKVCWANAPFSDPANATCIPNATTPFTHTALTNGTPYYYSVLAVATYNTPPYMKEYESAILTQISVIPGAYTPPAPTNITAVANSQEVDLSWKMDTSGGAALTYTIYWWTAATQTNPTKITGITSKSYSHTGLTAGVTYYYIVTATSQDGQESPKPQSAQVSATP